MTKYVIGVDGGTESIRAGVFDLTGHPLAFAAVPYATHYPHPSWAEQDPTDWWKALGEAVREAVLLAGVAPASIAGLAVDTTCCTVVALDAAGEPLRPAVLWQDMRAAEQASRVVATGDPALLVNCGGAGPVSAEWMVPKALWLKENEPDTFEGATYICEYQDFMQFHLTGRMVASLNNASVRWHYSTQRGGWPTLLLEKLGLEALLAKWPQEVVPLGAAVGGLTPKAADHLGLLPGTVVGQGGADAFVGMLGLGVTKAGQMALLTGSSHLHLGLSGHSFGGAGIFGTYSDAVLPGLHVVEGGQTSTGSILNWYRRLVGLDSYKELNAEAAEVPLGCEGLTALDHFMGCRTPHVDARSRGAVAGLTLKHGRGHVFRALLEAVCYGTECVLESMRAAGYSPSELRIAGGATRSPLWLQIHADVSNLPLQLTAVGDASVLGSAVLAAVAAGLHPSLQAAVAAMVRLGTVVLPDPERHRQYAQHYAMYQQLYPQLQPIHGSPPPAAADAGPPVAAPETTALLARADVGGLRARVSPSILSADFARLAEEVNEVFLAGAEWVHIDVFDGNFVPTLTLGPPVVKSLRKHTEAFLDCHLCVLHPETYIEDMAAAGANQFIFHLEAVDYDYAKAREMLADIRSRGMRAGIALEVGTQVDKLFPLLEPPAAALDVVLLLSVRAGFGGQKFQHSVLDKVRSLRARFSGDITVDGGIGTSNAAEVAAAGANCLVAGSSVFCGPKPSVQMVPDILEQIIAGLQQQEA